MADHNFSGHYNGLRGTIQWLISASKDAIYFCHIQRSHQTVYIHVAKASQRSEKSGASWELFTIHNHFIVRFSNTVIQDEHFIREFCKKIFEMM